MEMSQRDLQLGPQEVEERLRAEGIWSDSVRPIGNISDTIEGAILEHTPDLLMLGAYGYGPIDWLRLGSTAASAADIRCPVFVVGPDALLRDREAPPIERILCPTSSLDITDNIFSFAGHLAGRGGAVLELVYVVDPTQRDARHRNCEQRCEEWSAKVRGRGVKVTWSLLYGRADKIISERANESKASLILFGLHLAVTT